MLNKLTHWNTLCILLDCIYITRWYTVPTISSHRRLFPLSPLSYYILCRSVIWFSIQVKRINLVYGNYNTKGYALLNRSHFSCFNTTVCITDVNVVPHVTTFILNYSSEYLRYSSQVSPGNICIKYKWDLCGIHVPLESATDTSPLLAVQSTLLGTRII